MSTVAQHIQAVLDVLRANLGLAETPPGSNNNKIVEWYNAQVAKIGRGPWCEMTNTYAMWTGGAKPLKKGRAYTVWAAQDAVNGVNGSKWFYGTAGMRAGDQVYFDWNGPGAKDWRKVDHTGTVERINGDGTFYILEGNYGDQLRRMRRDAKFIVGYVRFDWESIATAPVPTKPSPVVPIVTKPRVPQQVKDVQKLLETTQDGQWGSQTDRRATAMRNAARAKLGWPKKARVSFSVGLVQEIIDTKVDGDWGSNSQAALKAWVKEFQKVLGVTQDGAWGPQTDNAFLAVRKRNLNQF